MKKFLAIVVLLVALRCSAQDSRIQPGGVPTPVPIFDISSITAIISNSVALINSNAAVISSNVIVISGLISNINISGEFQDGYTFQPVTSHTGSNTYWEDFGQTNPITGVSRVYATLSATNDVVFYGTTNVLRQWQTLSYNILSASSPYVRVFIPTNNLVLFPTNYNGWIFYPTNGYIFLYLTNGHAFRDSIQTNSFLEHRWDAK